jgi:hypothetical protein
MLVVTFNPEEFNFIVAGEISYFLFGLPTAVLFFTTIAAIIAAGHYTSGTGTTSRNVSSAHGTAPSIPKRCCDDRLGL